jgi:PDZ domain
VRIGTNPENPLVSDRRTGRLVLPFALGTLVLVAVIILVHASLDTDEPGQEKVARGPGRGSLASAPHQRPSHPDLDPLHPSAAGRTSGRSSVAPAAPSTPIARLGVAQSAANGVAASSHADEARPPAPAAGDGPDLRPARNADALVGANRDASRGGATAHPGGVPHKGTATTAGAGGHPADPKLARQADPSKRDAVWKRPPSEEDAGSKLVERFATSGGATLKGRVIDAETGRPSVGVAIEAHIGDSFMRTVSDNAGIFKMSGMLPARRITLWIIGRSDTFVAERIDVTSPSDGEIWDAGVVRLLRGDELAAHLEGWMGVFVNRRGPRNVVAAVSPWSPADRAGVQVGDVLLSIEGRDVDGLGPRATGFLLRGPVGTKANIAVQTREGSVHRVELERVLR